VYYELVDLAYTPSLRVEHRPQTDYIQRCLVLSPLSSYMRCTRTVNISRSLFHVSSGRPRVLWPMPCSLYCLFDTAVVTSQRVSKPVPFLPRDAIQTHPMQSCGVCPSVRPSATFVKSIATNKHIFNFFHLRCSHTILVFPYQTPWQYFDGTPPPNDRVECT